MTEQMYKKTIWLCVFPGKYFWVCICVLSSEVAAAWPFGRLRVTNSLRYVRQTSGVSCHPEPAEGPRGSNRQSQGKKHNAPTWGFYAHQQINRMAVFTLPPEMMPLYKSRLQYLTDNAVNPDKRRYAVVGEAPRHFIDLDVYADTTRETLPRSWTAAAERYTPDTLALHGIVPWHIQLAKYQLTEAFKEQNVPKILRLSADIGHYIADANVPLHTTRNYNGQLTNQTGIHGFWESRLPELFSAQYDRIVGAAAYVEHPQQRTWRAVFAAHAALDSVLRFERDLTTEFGDSRKWNFEDRNGQTVKVYSAAFAQAYHDRLRGQVERQLRASIKMVGDFWYTCWVDAGQPDLKKVAAQLPNQTEQEAEAAEKKSWLKRLFRAREEG